MVIGIRDLTGTVKMGYCGKGIVYVKAKKVGGNVCSVYGFNNGKIV